jgi:hypothetical protein
MSSAAKMVFTDDFCAEWVRNEDVTEVCMWGTAEAVSEPTMTSALNAVRSAAKEHPREIRIDLRAIDFLHSGCLKYLVSWIAPLQNRAADTYRIVLLWDPSMNWQKRTIYVLSALAPDVVSAIALEEPARPRPAIAG